MADLVGCDVVCKFRSFHHCIINLPLTSLRKCDADVDDQLMFSLIPAERCVRAESQMLMRKPEPRNETGINALARDIVVLVNKECRQSAGAMSRAILSVMRHYPTEYAWQDLLPSVDQVEIRYF